MNKERINREVEQTIDLLGNIKRSEADPYLYNKVIGRIEDSRSRDLRGQIPARTKLGYACITILIIINLITSAYIYYIYNEAGSVEEYSVYQDFAQEFNLNHDANLYTGL